MKTVFKIFLLFPVLSSCNNASSLIHPSLSVVQSFIQEESGVKDLKIKEIDVDKFHLKECWEKRGGRKHWSFEVAYDLTLEGENASYPSKAVVESTDNISWKMSSFEIFQQADSAGKHFEKTMAWENLDSLPDYKVILKVTH